LCQVGQLPRVKMLFTYQVMMTASKQSQDGTGLLRRVLIGCSLRLWRMECVLDQL